MKGLKSILFFFFFTGAAMQLFSQGKYQSLMWEISGNGLTKPSYLYGTMHISGKMVFHLGDPFYDAMASVDVVALELEPEAWLKAIFDDKSTNWASQAENSWTTDYGFGYDYEASLPQLKSRFAIDTKLQQKVKDALMYDPALLNYLLFRYGDYGYEADFEEDTWLDMYIYQTGKKLGKRTLGLETYEQSDYYIKQSRKEERNEKIYKEYDEGDIKELRELQLQFEPAYRRQDLDLIDSLNKRTTSPAFDKYILVERNKVFLHSIDSVLKAGQSLFACMGCAHLPGKSGIIELLRSKGYKVEAYNKGERNTKRRAKLEKVVFKRNYKEYETSDHTVKFETPAPVYYLGADKNVASWISLDIANGASFLVQRLKTYSSLIRRNSDDLLSSVDSLLYEAVAGDIVSQKRMMINGFPAIEVLNKSRRGDYQKRLIVALPEEFLILKLTATGEKVKTGFGSEFFSNLKIDAGSMDKNREWFSDDETISLSMPGSLVYYGNVPSENDNPDFEVSAGNFKSNTFYLAQRHTITDPEFLDEDDYELHRFADAFIDDNSLNDGTRSITTCNRLPALKAHFTNKNGRDVFALFVLQNLNYCAFSAFVDDSLLANAYFASIRFGRKSHEHFTLYQDTTMHFQTMLPYVPSGVDDDENENNWYFDSSEKEKNAFIGATAIRSYAVPGETDVINVQYQRYHKYSDGEDSLKFYRDKENLMKGRDMQMLNKNISWNDKGCVMNFEMADTNCSRHYRAKIVQYNKTVYTIQSSYDVVLGQSDFTTQFYDSFQPTDTVFPYYHYRNRDHDFLDQLMSSDSTTQSNAIGIISEMDFAASSIQRVREILEHLPEIKDVRKKEIVKEKLTLALAVDTSKTNIEYISSGFYRHLDSTAYQIELLNALSKMKTSSAWSAYMKMVLDEPPVMNGRSRTPALKAFRDTLQLAAPFMPDFMKLLALNEYEEPVYSLLAAEVDSNCVKPALYKSMVGQIVMEAKNELKRLNSTSESSYQFDTELFFDFCTLLQPYRSQSDVKYFFEKSYKTKRSTLLLELVQFDLEHNILPADSVISRICAHEDKIIPLYKVLYKFHHEDLLPEKFIDRDTFLAFYLKEKYRGKTASDSGVDSIMVFYKKDIVLKGHELQVNYVRYKKQKTKQWIGMIMAFEKSDPLNVWPSFIERSKTTILDKDEDEIKEMDRELKLLIEGNRKKLNFTQGAVSKNVAGH